MKFLNKELNLTRPHVMGILNVTPDSFSDGGQFHHLDEALYQAEKMIAQGADIIDVGGESTRPGAADVDVEQELERVIPVINALNQNFDVLLSIDTSKARVMSEAVVAGAGLINDVRALQEDGAMQAAAESGASVCLMHMQGQPRSMQHNPNYQHVVNDVRDFLQQRLQACEEAGINRQKLLIDPGFGFGKSLEHNYQLLSRLQAFHTLNVPLLVGMSRKSMLGKLLNREPDERLAGSIACATIAAMKGAQIIRVHDVQQSADALKVVQAMNQSG